MGYEPALVSRILRMVNNNEYKRKPVLPHHPGQRQGIWYWPEGPHCGEIPGLSPSATSDLMAKPRVIT